MTLSKMSLVISMMAVLFLASCLGGNTDYAVDELVAAGVRPNPPRWRIRSWAAVRFFLPSSSARAFTFVGAFDDTFFQRAVEVQSQADCPGRLCRTAHRSSTFCGRRHPSDTRHTTVDGLAGTPFSATTELRLVPRSMPRSMTSSLSPLSMSLWVRMGLPACGLILVSLMVLQLLFWLWSCCGSGGSAMGAPLARAGWSGGKGGASDPPTGLAGVLPVIDTCSARRRSGLTRSRQTAGHRGRRPGG